MLNEKKSDKNQNVILHFEFSAPAQKWKLADSITPIYRAAIGAAAAAAKVAYDKQYSDTLGTYIKLLTDMPLVEYGPITVRPPLI